MKSCNNIVLNIFNAAYILPIVLVFLITEVVAVNEIKSTNINEGVEEALFKQNLENFLKKIDERKKGSATWLGSQQRAKKQKRLENPEIMNLRHIFRHIFDKLRSFDDREVSFIFKTIENEMQKRHGKEFKIIQFLKNPLFRRFINSGIKEMWADPFDLLEDLINKYIPESGMYNEGVAHKRPLIKTEIEMPDSLSEKFFGWLNKVYQEHELVIQDVVQVLGNKLALEKKAKPENKALRQGTIDTNNTKNLVKKINEVVEKVLAHVLPDEGYKDTGNEFEELKPIQDSNSDSEKEDLLTMQADKPESNEGYLEVPSQKNEKDARHVKKKKQKKQKTNIDQSVMLVKEIIDLAMNAQSALQSQKHKKPMNSINKEQRAATDSVDDKKEEKVTTAEIQSDSIIDLIISSTKDFTTNDNNQKPSTEKNLNKADKLVDWKEKLRKIINNNYKNNIYVPKIKNHTKKQKRYDIIFRSAEKVDEYDDTTNENYSNTKNKSSSAENDRSLDNSASGILIDATIPLLPAVFTSTKKNKEEKPLEKSDMKSSKSLGDTIGKELKNSVKTTVAISSNEEIRFPKIKLNKGKNEGLKSFFRSVLDTEVADFNYWRQIPARYNDDSNLTTISTDNSTQKHSTESNRTHNSSIINGSTTTGIKFDSEHAITFNIRY